MFFSSKKFIAKKTADSQRKKVERTKNEFQKASKAMKETSKLHQDDEKQIDMNTYIVNLTEHRIIARVCKDKVNRKTMNWKRKQSNLILISKQVTAGVVEGIGGINIMDTHQQPEGHQSMQYSGFVIVLPLKSVTFSTKSEFNYVSIYANGVCKMDDEGTKHREIYVDSDGTVGSNAVMKIAEKYNDELFTHSYQASMVGALTAFKFSDHYTFYMDLHCLSCMIHIN